MEGQNSKAESTSSSSVTMLYLGTYFLINLGLTFYNKAVMGAVCHYQATDASSPVD